MKYRIPIIAAMTFAGVCSAQDRLADSLRKGIVEEESSHNFGAAIQNYASVMTQFGEMRQTAATALFRMAECYRKQRNRTAAIAAYRRVVKEFADQPKLAQQSRSVLAGTYHATDVAGSTAILSATDQQALQRYRVSIQKEIEAVRAQLETAQERFRAGVEGIAAVNEFKTKLAEVERELAAFDAGLQPVARK